MWPPDDVSVVVPLVTAIAPPRAVFPVPTVTNMLPDLPPVAALESIEMLPLLPALDVPVVKRKAPETPLCPASAVPKSIDPLEVAVLVPLVMPMWPPDDVSVVVPEVT